jgi:hypothetical protein
VVQRQLAGVALEDNQRRPASRRFSVQALLVLAVASIAEQWRLLIGRVPFPGDLVTRFPLFRNVSDAPRQPLRHAEMSDLATQFYSFRVYAGRAVHEGTLATWNSRILEGEAFLASTQSALLYPPNVVLYGLLPGPAAWSIGFWLRPVLAGFFTILFVRVLGASRVGALVAGFAFGFSGFVIGWGGWPQADTVIWLPLGLFAVHRLSQRPTGVAIAGTSVCLALPVLAGHPEVAAFGSAATLAFAAHRMVFREAGWATRASFVQAFVVAVVLAVGLAAVQILPAFEWISRLHRYHAGGSVPPVPLHDALSFVSRDAQGDVNSLGLHVTGVASYVGLVALIFAPLALLHQRRRDAVFFMATAAVTAQLVYGIGPLFWLSQHLPFVGSIANSMALGVLDLSIVVLAALGLTVLLHAPEQLRTRTRTTIVGTSMLAVVLALGSATWYSRRHQHGPPADWFRGVAATAALVLVVGTIGFLASTARLSRRVASVLILAIAVVDSTSYAYGHLPFLTNDQLFPPAPAFTELHQRDQSVYRIGALDGAYARNLELMYGFDSASGYDFPTEDAARLLDPVSGYFGISYDLSAAKIAANRDHRLDVMNLKYLFVPANGEGARLLAQQPDRFESVFNDGAVRVFANKSVLPRAFLVPASNVRPAMTSEAAFAALADPTFDPSTHVIIGPGAGVENDPQSPAATSVPSVSDVQSGETEVSMSVDAPTRSVVVFSQAIYPGWTPYVDGRRSTMLRADAMFQGVAVDPGRHTVEFRFESKSIRAGAVVSLLSFLAIVGLLGAPLVRRVRRRGRSTRPAS